MCISCRQLKPKRDLIRIVKDKDGNLEIDKSYKLQTRGMYICKNIDCVSNLKKSNKLRKQFNMDKNIEFYAKLERNMEN